MNATKHYSLTVRGSQHTWVFPIVALPEHVADWRSDGLDITEVFNTIPAHMPYWLMRLWVKAQDIWCYWCGERRADAVGINGLTEAETSATASVAGLVSRRVTTPQTEAK